MRLTYVVFVSTSIAEEPGPKNSTSSPPPAPFPAGPECFGQVLWIPGRDGFGGHHGFRARSAKLVPCNGLSREIQGPCGGFDDAVLERSTRLSRRFARSMSPGKQAIAPGHSPAHRDNGSLHWYNGSFPQCNGSLHQYNAPLHPCNRSFHWYNKPLHRGNGPCTGAMSRFPGTTELCTGTTKHCTGAMELCTGAMRRFPSSPPRPRAS